MKTLVLLVTVIAGLVAVPTTAAFGLSSAIRTSAGQASGCIEVLQAGTVSETGGSGGLGGTGDGGLDSADTTVERKIELKCDSQPPPDPVADSNVGHFDDATGDDSAPADLDANCSEEYTPPPSADGTIYATVCIKWRVCGGERLDDVVSGEIAGEESSGRYREYLSELTGSFNADGGGANLDPLDIDSINDILISQGLNERPSDQHLPVFYWCGDRDELFNLVGFDLASISFGWDLTYDDVYDIPGARNGLYIELLAQLDLYNPEIGLVPPVERGFTFVQWPTWMFLQNPSENIAIFTTNSTDTFRIDLRATLIGVQWHFGDTQLRECSAEEMVQFDFDGDTLHPIDDLPACHHIFTQLGCQDLTATTRFKIEEKVRGRLSATLDPYPDPPWTDYLGTPTTIELSSTLDNYEVHPIGSVNAPFGQTRDQIITNARAAGTLPSSASTCTQLANR